MMWNLGTSIAAIGWLAANTMGAVLVALHPMYLPHFVANTVAVYAFSTWAGAKVDASTVSKSLPLSLAVGSLLGPVCFALGAIALLLVNVGYGLYDDCCSQRFGGHFGLGTGSISGTLWHAFARPLGWILLFGGIPALLLGAVYGTLLYFRRPRRPEPSNVRPT